MAQFYKVDNRLLNEEEYNEHCIGLWAVCLFIGGAIFCGYYLHGMIPADWAKEWRFVALILPCILVGGILARFANLVRNLFFCGLALLAVYGVATWIWSIL
jgi:hypothetical protein